MWACIKGDHKLVNLLLSKKVRINSANKVTMTMRLFQLLFSRDGHLWCGQVKVGISSLSRPCSRLELMLMHKMKYQQVFLSFSCLIEQGNGIDVGNTSAAWSYHSIIVRGSMQYPPSKLGTLYNRFLSYRNRILRMHYFMHVNEQIMIWSYY